MSSPPTGTVTFLFTDIEESTAIAQAQPERWPEMQARHHAILHGAVAAHRGHVFQVIGDAFCAAFATPVDALSAAIEAQRALMQEPWPAAPIRVRMGLHCGPAEWRDGDYRGYLTLVRVQRIMSLAHGGQVLLSDSTAELVRDDLPEGLSFRDLGEHRLKGVLNPEHILQLVLPDLPSEFPPLQSLGVLPHNLPTALTSFIGRERELAEIKRLFAGTRLLTLTGVGGTGKTRLALQAGAELLERFAHGVWLIELAPLADPELVPAAVASALQVREQPGRAILDVLKDYVGPKHLLLILDNCEHLIEGCAQLADTLLRSAPDLMLLATSREALGIAGEHTYPVPSLSLPPASAALSDDFSRSEAVRLFLDRARAVQPAFALTNANARAVAEICRRLDGIPLAVELAAARVKGLSAEQIAAHLNDRFRLLTGGSRTALPRQRTLQAAIDWSYRLLSEPERVLLRRLSVFAGGWTMEAAEQVTAEVQPSTFNLQPSAVLDLLLHLVDQSLVVADTQAVEPRYHLLETIRQYAQEKLDEAGESNSLRGRQLEFFLQLVEAAELKLRGPEQLAWLDRLDPDHDNLRSALGWALESHDSQAALRLSLGLALFWVIRGYFREGRQWFERAVAGARGPQLQHAPAAERVRYGHALNWAGLFAEVQGDFVAARASAEEGLAVLRELRDKVGLSFSLRVLAQISHRQGDFKAARALHEESLRLARESGDKWSIALALNTFGRVARSEGEYAEARALVEEGLVLSRELGSKFLISAGLLGLEKLAYVQGDLVSARAFGEDTLALGREQGSQFGIAVALGSLGLVMLAQGERDAARQLLAEGLALSRELGVKRDIARNLVGWASLALAETKPREAATLLGAIAGWLGTIGSQLDEPELSVQNGLIASLHGQLDKATFEAAWHAGQRLSIEQAIQLAIES